MPFQNDLILSSVYKTLIYIIKELVNSSIVYFFPLFSLTFPMSSSVHFNVAVKYCAVCEVRKYILPWPPPHKERRAVGGHKCQHSSAGARRWLCLPLLWAACQREGCWSDPSSSVKGRGNVFTDMWREQSRRAMVYRFSLLQNSTENQNIYSFIHPSILTFLSFLFRVCCT